MCIGEGEDRVQKRLWGGLLAALIVGAAAWGGPQVSAASVADPDILAAQVVKDQAVVLPDLSVSQVSGHPPITLTVTGGAVLAVPFYVVQPTLSNGLEEEFVAGPGEVASWTPPAGSNALAVVVPTSHDPTTATLAVTNGVGPGAGTHTLTIPAVDSTAALQWTGPGPQPLGIGSLPVTITANQPVLALGTNVQATTAWTTQVHVPAGTVAWVNPPVNPVGLTLTETIDAPAGTDGASVPLGYGLNAAPTLPLYAPPAPPSAPSSAPPSAPLPTAPRTTTAPALSSPPSSQPRTPSTPSRARAPGILAVGLQAPPTGRPQHWIPVTIRVTRDGRPVAHTRIRVTATGDPPQVQHRWVTTNGQGLAHDAVRGPVPSPIRVQASLRGAHARAVVHLQSPVPHRRPWWWLLVLLLLLLLLLAYVGWRRRRQRAQRPASGSVASRRDHQGSVPLNEGRGSVTRRFWQVSVGVAAGVSCGLPALAVVGQVLTGHGMVAVGDAVWLGGMVTAWRALLRPLRGRPGAARQEGSR